MRRIVAAEYVSLDGVMEDPGPDGEYEHRGWTAQASRDLRHRRHDARLRARGMTDVTELRVALTVAEFDEALTFYRDALGLQQIANSSSGDGRVVVLAAGRATLELLDDAQAATVDRIEAGQRVSGTVRLALEVRDSKTTASRLVAAGAEEVAPPVTTPWGDRNARVRAPDGMQLTLFTTS